MNDNTLLYVIPRLAIWVAEWPLEVNGTRWPHFLRNLTQPDHTNGWNPRSLNGSCDQSNGLVAEPSGWAQ
jgi:hypothetical protein